MRRKKIRNSKLIFNKNLILIFILLILIIWFSQLDFLKVNVENEKLHIKNLNILYYIFFKKELAKAIFEKCSDVIKIKFKPNFLTYSLDIELIKESPVAIICGSKCFYLGTHSYIYKAEVEDKYLPIYSQLEILENSYLKPNIENAFSKLFEYSNLNNIFFSKVEILSNQDLKFFTNDNKEILIDPNQNIEEQIKKLHYFLNNYKDSNYSRIDLRIPRRLYFK